MQCDPDDSDLIHNFSSTLRNIKVELEDDGHDHCVALNSHEMTICETEKTPESDLRKCKHETGNLNSENNYNVNGSHGIMTWISEDSTCMERRQQSDLSNYTRAHVETCHNNIKSENHDDEYDIACNFSNTIIRDENSDVGDYTISHAEACDRNIKSENIDDEYDRVGYSSGTTVIRNEHPSECDVGDYTSSHAETCHRNIKRENHDGEYDIANTSSDMTDFRDENTLVGNHIHSDAEAWHRSLKSEEYYNEYDVHESLIPCDTTVIKLENLSDSESRNYTSTHGNTRSGQDNGDLHVSSMDHNLTGEQKTGNPESDHRSYSMIPSGLVKSEDEYGSNGLYDSTTSLNTTKQAVENQSHGSFSKQSFTSEHPMAMECDDKCTTMNSILPRQKVIPSETSSLNCTEEKLYRCGVCGYSATVTASLMMSHMLTHKPGEHNIQGECDFVVPDTVRSKSPKPTHVDKPYKCDQCTFCTAQYGSLTRHKKMHSKDTYFKCKLCDYTIARSEDFKIHMMGHRGEKPYKCDTCDFSTNRHESLRRHKMLHTDEKPYMCDVCGFTTRQKANFQRHRLIHTGEKPYKCLFCDYRTARPCHLKIHTMTHTGKKPHKCDVCSYSTTRAGDLRRHKKKHM